jgi:3-hydroxyisobutyrate dehydrogenase-like beta-hydroxyacid dehydrogenase
VLRALETTAAVARATSVHAPLVEACRAAWAAAQAEIGSGADQSELIRWLESVSPPDPGTDQA